MKENILHVRIRPTLAAESLVDVDVRSWEITAIGHNPTNQAALPWDAYPDITVWEDIKCLLIVGTAGPSGYGDCEVRCPLESELVQPSYRIYVDADLTALAVIAARGWELATS